MSLFMVWNIFHNKMCLYLFIVSKTMLFNFVVVVPTICGLHWNKRSICYSRCSCFHLHWQWAKLSRYNIQRKMNVVSTHSFSMYTYEARDFKHYSILIWIMFVLFVFKKKMSIIQMDILFMILCIFHWFHFRFCAWHLL